MNLAKIPQFCAIGDAMTESPDPLYLHETRATGVVVVQIALMALATAAVILIAVHRTIVGIPWSLEDVLTMVALV